MSLNWTEIGSRWPDAVVLWDRDVAPTLDWEPVFRERDSVLWADCIRDHWHLARARRDLLLVQDVLPDELRRPCRCRVWEPTLKEWWTHERWARIRMTLALQKDLAERRFFIRVTPWRHTDGLYFEDDRFDATRYAYHHLWPLRWSPADE